MTSTASRVERDSMGQLEVPADAYYGASSARARDNFPISDLRFNRGFIRALGLIKQAAAQVNLELGLLDPTVAGAVARAAAEVAGGRFDDQFVVDIFQTGSGTSTNMNANEVIANRAIELLGGERGSRTPVHPNDHVNLGQSSNDVIPSAIQVAAAVSIREDTISGLEILEASLRRKSEEFWPVIKTGRTHLQDATPIRLGQEFLGLAPQRRLENLQARDGVLAYRDRRRHLDRRRNHVVARLPEVDVVVGVHRGPRAALPAEQLDGPVGDHLVGIHVGRGSAPSLEHIDDELPVERSVDDVLGGSGDRAREVLVEQSQLAIDQGRLLLDQPDGADEPPGQAQIADRKVDLRAHGVGAVIGVIRDLELAH